MDYYAPTDLRQTLKILCNEDARIIAGATDVFPAGVDRPQSSNLLDITHLSDLKRIEVSETQIKIGGGVTWAQIVQADLPKSMEALKQAALQIGGRQIQNAGTIAGNICNASPAADGVPPLQIFDAEVELMSIQGTRTVKLSDFITDRGSTVCKNDELVSNVILQNAHNRGASVFEKLGSRSYLVISIAMVAAFIRMKRDGQIDEARISVGACSPVAMRMRELEKHLLGKTPTLPLDPSYFSNLSPISDARGSEEYRKACVIELCRRAISKAAAQNG